MQFKSNLLSISTILLLILMVGILFCYGGYKIKQANDVQSTIIAWESLADPNTEGNLENSKNEDLTLLIQNLELQKQIYSLDFLINEKIIDSQRIEISSQHKEIIKPTKKALAKLTELSKTQFDTLYQIKVSWGKNKTEILGKWIKK